VQNLQIEKISKPFDIVISNIASDKSISHRCAIFSLLSDKPSFIKNYLRGEDTMNSLKIIQNLGAIVEDDGETIKITPPKEIKEPDDILDCGNSGTAIRLFIGLLSSLDGSFILTGDKYLKSRPMERVVNPLQSVGALIYGRQNANLAPLTIIGKKLNSFRYESPIDSAQIKSALILASIQSDEISYYKENLLSRDHSERMLNGMGANIKTLSDGYIQINPLEKKLNPLNITVPSDPSSAFFFAVASAIIPNSKVVLKNLTLNPTRIEAYKILQQMGAKVKFIQKENIYEPIGDIEVQYGKLDAITIDKNIAWLIDELPALSIAMAVANGKSVVKNAKELRVKESDRISVVVDNLKLCGVDVLEFEDGYSIVGGKLSKATINSKGDHRIAMSFAIGGLLCGADIKDTACIQTSFPNFLEILEQLQG
jgi:3-phosphoshikimate 1-carboxyvinyltransferase